ncbi:uncharacterized protein K460DRAFT_414843 [Cucurbitaria berberidis CBS 394.84]|uniref:Uncharacterized protein n=1 Tax=Cucurbitaria berberidis CBS 394.84 TaxID=1168544 RepID=A0A9P4GNI9_9PLEO|nr:uncharacterized protein K460DRAFT_414843 [Cucurbitaria berberidis CBS 394.84]KAF1848260.1 hypothetical protein K460DRAFT_414843 [Cucurbitaria berberidis CBS 394.84]
MDHDMSPLLSAMDAPLIKAESVSKPTEPELVAAQSVKLEEGEIEEPRIEISPSRSLAAYSFSPPPLIDDGTCTLTQDDDTESRDEPASLRAELELAKHEYAALEERYCTLSNQHRELRKLASAYSDVIRGFSSNEDETSSVEHFRTASGRYGLQARAFEADVAGGLQALVSRAKSVRSLIEKAGGIQELEDLVSKAHMFRRKVNEVGGLLAFDHLVSEVNLLRSKQQEHAELMRNIDGLEKLKIKAAKYDRLEQTFNEMKNAHSAAAHGSSLLHANMAPMHASHNLTEIPTGIDQNRLRSNTTPVAAANMNPARANRISATRVVDDPDRDLYEAEAPVIKPQNRTGSNNVPLGPSHVSTLSVDKAYRRATLKRKGDNEPPSNHIKRPQIDVGRASALVQAILPTRSTKRLKHDLVQVDWRSARIVDGKHARNLNGGARFESLAKGPSVTTAPSPTVMAATVSSEIYSNDFQACGYSAPLPRINFVHQSRLPMVKTEDTENKQLSHHPMSISIVNDMNLQQAAIVSVRRYPIAVWVGSSPSETDSTPADLRKTDEMPSDLANFLSSELMKYINVTNLEIWNSMPANPDTCILRYIVDGHRPSGQPQTRRVCRTCSSAFVSHHRPCALLQDVDGVRTVVFLPLRDALRRGISWTDKQYWVMDPQYGRGLQA